MSAKQQRFEPRILFFFLLVGLIPPVIGHLFLVAGARELVSRQMQDQAGQRATDIQRDLAGVIEGAVLQIANLASSDVIEETARAAERGPASADQIEQQVVRIESNWASMRADESPLRQILQNPTSVFLRRQNEIHATFREILVTDGRGRLIAATNKTSDYFQADEQWWLRAFLQGTGASFVGDLTFDESANIYGLEIAEPIHDETSGAVIGVVKGILDSPALFSRLEEANYATAEKAMLVRPDGTVVWEPDGSLNYPYGEQLREAIEQGRQSFVYSSEEADYLVGLPPTGVDARVPALNWYVIVQHDQEAAMAPVRDLNSRFFMIVVVTVIVILVVALVFTRMLSKPIVEIDPHFDELA